MNAVNSIRYFSSPQSIWLRYSIMLISRKTFLLSKYFQRVTQADRNYSSIHMVQCSKYTVLQDGQFAALRNKYWSLNFLQILMIFCNKNPQFCEFLTNFLLKMAKMVIFKAWNSFKSLKFAKIFPFPVALCSGGVWL